MATPAFTLIAPAKLNLFLHVTGKRPDGYHLLQSLMGFVDVGDQLEFSPYDGFFIDAIGPFGEELAAEVHNNLIYKAARLLAEEYKVKLQGRVTLTKNLPIAAGLAGGSSDAATTLRGLVQLWRLPEERTRLEKIALQLGADVLACMYAKPVWAEGIGEKLTYLQGMPDMHFVIVNPLQATPTPEVFRIFNAKFSPALQFSGRRKSMNEWIADFKLYRNDLTEAAVVVCPIIRDVLRVLGDTPNCQFARMTGSGASCFGMYESSFSAQAAVNKLRQARPDWWVVGANLLK